MRRRRSLANITTLPHPDMEEQEEEGEDLRQEEVEINEKNNSSFSESLRLFQSLQVLANEDDREALRNETTASKRGEGEAVRFSSIFLGVLVAEADYCFSSLMFSSVVGVVTLLMIMSGASITLLCTRLRRERREGKETASDVVHTLR